MSCNSESDSTGAAIAITCIVTFIISITAATIITFIVTYYVCVKRTFENIDNYQHQPPHEQEKVLYEEMSSPTNTISKDDLEMQKNPAYKLSPKVVTDTNPAYETCK